LISEPNFYESIVEHASAIIVSWNLNGDIEYINNYGCQFFGFSKKELIGKKVIGTITPMADSSGDDLNKLISEIAKSPASYELNINENVRKSGERVWISWTNKLLTVGDKAQVLSIGVDVTAQRNLESQLKQSQKMQSIGLLAGGVAHDFNNLIQSISGFAELIQEADNLTSARQFAQKILNASMQAKGLTNSLLSFSRKDRVLKSHELVSDVVQEACDLVQPALKKHVTVNWNPTNSTLYAVIDRGCIVSAIVNLLMNANDALVGNSCGVIDISVKQINCEDRSALKNGLQLRTGKYVVIEVADNGAGMTPTEMQRIFEPFYTSKAAHEGTGLGLSSVYTVADAHGGAIDCESTVDQGSKFSLYIRQEPYRHKAPKQLPTITHLKSQRILLIDDEQMVCEFSEALLTKKGHEITTFGSPTLAVEHYRQHFDSYDIVIIDMLMPEMDGVDVLTELTKINPKVSAVLATGYASPDQLSRARGAGFKKILKKPFQYPQLMEVLSGVDQSENVAFSD